MSVVIFKAIIILFFDINECVLNWVLEDQTVNEEYYLKSPLYA